MSLQEQIRANRVRSAFVLLGVRPAHRRFRGRHLASRSTRASASCSRSSASATASSRTSAPAGLVASVAHAHPVTKEEQPELVRAVENVAIAAGLDRTPPVYLIEDDAPNAFAAGRKPEGRVRGGDDRPRRAHGPARARGRDGARDLAHPQPRRAADDARRRARRRDRADGRPALPRQPLRRRPPRQPRRGGNPITLVIGIAALVLAPISAALLQASLSRRREYLADASAAEITGDPEGLARALAKLGNDKRPLKYVTRATAHLYIESPLRDNVGPALEPRRPLRHAPAARGPHPPPRGGRRLRHPRSGAARPVTLPLTPTIEPQLAKTATELPAEGAWLYEPKWDGFRVIAFVDGDEVFLQSRNGKPLDRYFPELSLPPGRYVLDGEIVDRPRRRQPGLRRAAAAHPPGGLARRDAGARDAGVDRRLRPARRGRRGAARAAVHRAPGGARASAGRRRRPLR